MKILTGFYNRLHIVILMIGLVFLPGCAGMKEIVQDTHSTLMSVMILTDLDEVEEQDQLYAVEKRIQEVCSPMLASARIRMDGEEIPLFTMIEFLLSYENCRQTINEAQREIAVLSIRD